MEECVMEGVRPGDMFDGKMAGEMCGRLGGGPGTGGTGAVEGGVGSHSTLDMAFNDVMNRGRMPAGDHMRKEHNLVVPVTPESNRANREMQNEFARTNSAPNDMILDHLMTQIDKKESVPSSGKSTSSSTRLSRLTRNRESAKKSRMQKKEELARLESRNRDLKARVKTLKDKNEKLRDNRDQLRTNRVSEAYRGDSFRQF